MRLDLCLVLVFLYRKEMERCSSMGLQFSALKVTARDTGAEIHFQPEFLISLSDSLANSDPCQFGFTARTWEELLAFAYYGHPF